MLKIYKIAQTYVITKNDKELFKGSFTDIFMNAPELKLELTEFFLAKKVMEESNHNCAEFGVFGKFILSKNEEYVS